MEIVSYEETNIPTPEEIRNRWCFGLPLSKDDGGFMPDEDIQQYIDAAIQLVERKLGVFLKPTIIACNPEERGLVEDVDYELSEPPYDYDIRKYKQWGFMQLRQRLIQRVTGLKLVYPNGHIIVDFMKHKEWVKLYPKHGQIQIVPNAGSPTVFAMMGGSQMGYPFVTGMMNAQIPQMFYVDYVAGYPVGKIPEDIRNVIAKIAAIDVLGIAGDAVYAGISSMSTSIDGLSESLTTTASAENATYTPHIKQYQSEVDAFFSPKGGGGRSATRGITFGVL